MKKISLILTFLFLLSATFVIQSFKEAKANFGVMDLPGTAVYIEQPKHGSEYYTNSIPIIFNITHARRWFNVDVNLLSFSFSLNNQEFVSFQPEMIRSYLKPDSISVYGFFQVDGNISQWRFNLPILSNGLHKITIQVKTNEVRGLNGIKPVTAISDTIFFSMHTGAPLIISMPKEYIEYTITNNKGTYQAKVHGKYPITILNNHSSSTTSIPMVYPTPPNTTNIQITLNGKELSWTNYTKIYPSTLHHTAIGNWPMIYCMIENVSDSFLLEIQYEHTITQINESYVFLYDLNITPYLSPNSSESIAYFTINFKTDTSDIHLFTTKTDTKWNPLNYTTQQNSSKIITAQIRSEYLEPIQGDLAIAFKAPSSQEILSFFFLSSLFATLVFEFGIFVYFNKYRKEI